MKFLVTGSSGMLGSAFCRQLKDGNMVFGMDTRPFPGSLELSDFQMIDITDSKAVNSFVSKIRPDVVIHAAAYTDVDSCEQNVKGAFDVNAEGTKNLAQASFAVGAKIVYISTDYIFDGFKKTPYTELDVPNPVNVYGKSKLKGEEYIKNICSDFLIVRSSGLYGAGGKNFVDTILKSAKMPEDLKVVDDQRTCPTYVVDLAEAVRALIAAGKTGVYNVVNSGVCSWYEFAARILNVSKTDKNITAIKSGKSGRLAARPEMSALDCGKYNRQAGRPMRSWEEALEEYLNG